MLQKSGVHGGPRRGAFTLIELLVVISIIALLAAILFPVFARVRGKARQSACASNMKQIGLGIIQYSQDYDESLPFVDYGPTPGASQPTTSDLAAGRYKWMDAIYPYVKSEQVFDDPSAPKYVRRYKYYQNLTGPSEAYGSYALNEMYYLGDGTIGGVSSSSYLPFECPFSGTWYTGPLSKVSKIANVAETVYAVDSAPTSQASSYNSSNGRSHAMTCGAPSNAQCTPDGTPLTPAMDSNTGSLGVLQSIGYSAQISFRHFDMTNVLWADGHVKAMSGAALLTQGTIVYNGTRHSLKYFTNADD
jgi:prepilin-type N-terminal cleavage/methylation domain-containing protein/prepilin-type processing-associated H-X9-DG protein